MQNSYRNYPERPPLFRARNGKILGVCLGISRHLEIPVKWIRLMAILGCIMTGIWPGVALYAVAALLMKPEPVVPFQSVEDEDFYNTYVSSRSMALHRLKKTFENLDRRIRRMEDIVTAPDYDWDSRLHE
ncbi:MAG: PspC domain-containing protein [Candidatus Omnitrophica bacterium]|nr:PspC domain-containing protein [Candidatus Omnitrophota bacterium]